MQIGSHNLIGVDEDDLFEIHREENVKEEDLVPPDDTLFFFLATQPGGPFVRDELVLEPVLFRKMR